MSTGLHAAICILAFISYPVDQQALSRDEALRVLQQSSLIRPTDKVSVDAISSSPGSTEAVVRATIAGSTVNLKLRRFDTGWTWEFVETKSAGWVSPDVAIGQIREQLRVVAAAEWADQNRAAYAATAQTMEYVARYHVPNPTMLENPAAALKYHGGLVTLYQSKPEEWRDELAVLTSDSWTDAWGSEILATLNTSDTSTLIASPGPDKTQGTEDDILCLNTFRRGSEAGRLVWNKDKSWKVPEGLGSAVKRFFDERTDKLEYSKVVKP